MTTLTTSFAHLTSPQFSLSSGSSLKSACQGAVNVSHCNLYFMSPVRQSHIKHTRYERIRKTLAVQASGDAGKSTSGNIFIGAFILGGIVVGTLGCLYASQISKSMAGADSKDLLRKLPDFIYNEEKALEKTRKKLEEKITKLSKTIDEVSSQLRSNQISPNEASQSTIELI
ncbi:uncharacterized protein LOC113291606 [Papaver somniferum]|uniref:uncharacterized protein LOC113291606 n=1 Tax=Papaver somniferum TaxID=3469 RepID=UPI000E6FE48E|nr:uncharacterized protein LOC113291606 [Papaver somniferum]